MTCWLINILQTIHLYNNSAGVSGGGIYTYDMTSNIMNCILWGNTAPSNPQIAGTVNVTYSDVEGGWTGTGNINEHPLFEWTQNFIIYGITLPVLIPDILVHNIMMLKVLQVFHCILHGVH